TYRSHANCTYADGTVNGQAVEMVNATIEDWTPAQQADTLVLINVLHHCKDARAMLDKVRTALRDGGLLIFHEPPREIDPLTHYDAGHPLAPHATFLSAFLEGFEEVYRNGWYFIGRKIALSSDVPLETTPADADDTAEAEVVTELAPKPQAKAPVKRKTAKQ